MKWLMMEENGGKWPAKAIKSSETLLETYSREKKTYMLRKIGNKAKMGLK